MVCLIDFNSVSLWLTDKLRISARLSLKERFGGIASNHKVAETVRRSLTAREAAEPQLDRTKPAGMKNKSTEPVITSSRNKMPMC